MNQRVGNYGTGLPMDQTNSRNNGAGQPESIKNFGKSEKYLLGEELERDSYYGSGIADVWCPQTEFFTWVVRQGSTVTITGNSI